MLKISSITAKRMVLSEYGFTLATDSDLNIMFRDEFLRYNINIELLQELIDIYNISPIRAKECFNIVKMTNRSLISHLRYIRDYVECKTNTDYAMLYNALPDESYFTLLIAHNNQWEAEILRQLEPQYYPRLEPFFSEGMKLRYKSHLDIIRNNTHNFAEASLKTTIPFIEKRIELSCGYGIYIPKEYTAGDDFFIFDNNDKEITSLLLYDNSMPLSYHVAFDQDDINAILQLRKEVFSC